MDDKVLAWIKRVAEQIVSESFGRKDALKYAEQLAGDVNVDLNLGYERDSDSFGVLHKACYSAIWDASKPAHTR